MKQKILVIGGCGAIGSVLSILLQSLDTNVVVVDRSSRGCKIGRIVVEGLGSAEVEICGWDSIGSIQPNVLIYAVKAYDVETAVSSSLELGWNPDLVVSVQNGLGSLELLERVYGADRVVAALIFFGSTYKSKCYSHFAGGNKVVIGSRRKLAHKPKLLVEAIASILSRKSLSVEVVDNIEPYRWTKLAVNAGINPVTVLSWSKNRVIIDNSSARELATILAEETVRVAREKGIELPIDPIEEMINTARQTANNCSSMIQDYVRHGRSEIDYINRAVWLKSLETNTRALANYSIYLAVRLREPWLREKKSPCET